jgi:signal transduction histidine kinase
VLPGLPDRHLIDPLAAQRRLVLAADAERRRIERELHEGVQQQLVALAVKVQLARASTSSEALDEIAHDVDRAIADLRRLAERIRPPLVESGGFTSAVRSAAASSPGSIEIAADFGCAPELAGTLYACCVEALERGMTISLRVDGGTLVFEIVEAADRSDVVEGIRDRVEAIGGKVVVEPHST